MRLIVAGPRDITPEIAAYGVGWAIRATPWLDRVAEVVHGDSGDTDVAAGEWAELHGVGCTPFPAEWDKHGKAAGPIRNREMALYAQPGGALVALWDGKTPGTKNMIETAVKYGLPVFVWPVRR